jgi:hypothetical protein
MHETTQQGQTPKVGHDRLFEASLASIKPSPENDQLYGPVNPSDPNVIALARDIRRRGVLEPLVVTADDFIVSGHRRYAAAKLAGLKTIPVRRIDRRHSDPDFVQLLAAYNQQRVKTTEERTREELVAAADPEAAHRELLAYRRRRAQPGEVEGRKVELNKRRPRKKISKAKMPMLEAVLRVVNSRRDFWPLSDRLVHYGLLNAPPLRHASKPTSTYRNDLESYKNLCDLLTRARLTGQIPMEAIDDETRAVCLVRAFADAGGFVRHETDWFLRGYARDLQRSQPVHVEVLAEKLTVQSIVEPVCQEYCLPLTIGRGYSSLPPRTKMSERFKRSGKDQMVLVVISDADPEGESIAESFARSMRDDFGIATITCVKAALTPGQARQLGLPTAMTAKAKSSRRAGFVAKHGELVWELEALDPQQLQAILRQTIEGVIDRQALRQEIETEKRDAAYLSGLRQNLLRHIAAIRPAASEEEE